MPINAVLILFSVSYLCDVKKNSFESDRISLNKKPEYLEIVINGSVPSQQKMILIAWLIAWTGSGIYVFSQMFSQKGDTLIFMIVWMFFWLYFEYRIAKAWLWRSYGKEVMQIRKNEIKLLIDVPLGKKEVTFSTDGLSGWHNLEKDKSAFVRNFYSAFWNIGGETIGFFHKTKLHVFARQISETDADALLSIIKRQLN
jgi:hypothetical protein